MVINCKPFIIVSPSGSSSKSRLKVYFFIYGSVYSQIILNIICSIILFNYWHVIHTVLNLININKLDSHLDNHKYKEGCQFSTCLLDAYFLILIYNICCYYIATRNVVVALTTFPYLPVQCMKQENSSRHWSASKTRVPVTKSSIEYMSRTVSSYFVCSLFISLLKFNKYIFLLY